MYDKENCAENVVGTIRMYVKNKLSLAMIVMLISGCAEMYMQPVDVSGDADCVPEVVYAGPDAGKSDFVPYTDVAADYRQYGERTPRDQNVVSTGAGSNMSASIPPSIDEEVDEYDEAMEHDDSDNDGASSSQNVEDPVEDWLAEEGQNLKSLLKEWGDRAGWRVVWKTNRNYPLTAGAMFRGRFADASAALIRTFARAKPAPIATYYKGNRVLVVETMEDENAFE